MVKRAKVSQLKQENVLVDDCVLEKDSTPIMSKIQDGSATCKTWLAAVVEKTSDSVAVVDVQGRIEYVNEAFESITGYSRGEILGCNLSILEGAGQGEQSYSTVWETISSQSEWNGKLTHLRKNRSVYKEEVKVSAVFDSLGELCNYIVLSRDITREEQLERQLHQTMKMKALGTLAGGIAHDFNNILSSMIGYSEIVRDRLEPGHEAVKELEQVIAGGDRAVDLVKQILTFSRKESEHEFRHFKIQHIVKEIVKLLHPSLPATIKLEYDLDPDCGMIFGDPSQMYQVIMNLCTNARQAIGEKHGKISILLRQVDSNGSGVKERKYLQLEVRDNGCGMESHVLDKIFDPFFSTKKGESGTGLGLAVVRRVVQKHKGEILVNSRVGEGTSFLVSLAVEHIDSAVDVKTVSELVGGNERIMIIEDEKMIADIFQTTLDRAGYRVTSFVDSMEAVTSFRRDPGRWDLVITDMQMPNYTGAEVTREFLALRPELPIIMFTGYSEGFDREKAMKLGARDFLFKPVRKDELHQAVRNVFRCAKNSGN